MLDRSKIYSDGNGIYIIDGMHRFYPFREENFKEREENKMTAAEIREQELYKEIARLKTQNAKQAKTIKELEELYEFMNALAMLQALENTHLEEENSKLKAKLYDFMIKEAK